jgi:sugar/nucleoside kinase (ribokinase family)
VPDKKFDVLVAGELNIDLILNGLEKFPEVGKEILAKKMIVTLGSSSAIFASNLSTLGTRVAFCGCIGKDGFAEKILHDLAAKNVDCSNIIRSESADTGITVALNVNEDRAMVTYPGAMNELKSSDITDAMLSGASHLHVSSIFLQPALKPGLTDLFRRARALGLTTSLDPQWDPAETWECDLQELLPYVNIFLPNIEELKNLTGQNSIDKAIACIQKTADTIVIKNGNSGAMLRNHHEFLDQRPFLNTDVVDAIGAGDSFNAGFIHQFINDNTPSACLEFGALCGAINTTESGGTTAFADYDTVRRIALNKFNFLL